MLNLIRLVFLCTVMLSRLIEACKLLTWTSLTHLNCETSHLFCLLTMIMFYIVLKVGSVWYFSSMKFAVFFGVN
jgi:hypothetical protein